MTIVDVSDRVWASSQVMGRVRARIRVKGVHVRAGDCKDK